MATESPFVAIALESAREVLKPPFVVQRGAALLYQVTVDNQLNLTVDPKRPMRGVSAFQTDLCIFEKMSEKVVLPRVVMEFKTSITTHDVLTYSAKARKHKQVYPYLRYGIVSEDSRVPGRFFTHNESLDFFAAVGAIDKRELSAFLAKLLEQEAASSKQMELIAFGSLKTRLWRNEVGVERSNIG